MSSLFRSLTEVGKLSGRNVINQQPAFYCTWLNELNMHNDTLMLHYPSNCGENTAPAEKLAEELVVRVLNLMMAGEFL